MTFTETYEKFFDGDKFMHVAITNTQDIVQGKTTKKLGKEFKIPKNTTQYLTYLYGNWKKKSNVHSHISKYPKLFQQ